jgi:hypothetical protein
MSSDLPDWPAALNQKMAAAYCGLSVDLFKQLCPVRPLQYTQSAWGHRYLRSRLDDWMLSLDPNSKRSAEVSFGDFFNDHDSANQRP